MPISELTKEILKFIADRDWNQFHSPKNMATAINVEAGELLETMIWTDPSFEDIKNNPELKEAIEQELADILIYALEMYHHLGTDPEDSIRKKIELNAKKYPVEKAKGSSKKYDKL